MKLISLWEPWATLMAIGAKRIETRSWSTPYRGWLAIQASKGGLPKRELQNCIEDPAFRTALSGQTLQHGCIVAVVKLVECLPTVTVGCRPGVFDDFQELDTEQEREFGDFSEGRYGWVTECCFRLPRPISFKAKQGINEVGINVVVEIRDQWKAANGSCARIA